MNIITKAPAPKEEITAQFTLKEMIKKAAEVTTVGLASSYVLGFLIVNSYLLKYGYAGASLFKVKYISAGLLFLGISLILALSIYPIIWATKESKKFDSLAPALRRKAMITGSGVAVIFLAQILNQIASRELKVSYEEDHSVYVWVIATIAVSWLFLLVLQEGQWSWPLAIWLKQYPGLSTLFLGLFLLLSYFKVFALIFLVPLIVFIWAFLELAMGNQQLGARFKDWPLSPIYDLLVMLLFVIFAINFFANQFYGFANPQYGGGLPANVKVVIAGEKSKQLSKLGNPENVEALLNNARLIDSSEKEFLFLLKTDDEGNERLLQLDRSMVDAVLYLQ